MPRLPDVQVKNFENGVVTRVEEESLPRGAASDALNWIFKGDRVELRGGQAVLGTGNDGVGKITGLKVARRFDGTEIPFKAYNRKLKYYDADSEDWVEIGTDTLSEDADGEDVAIDEYHSLAGAFVYVSSPNSSIYKIPIANPGSVVDQSSTSHRGKFRIKQGRTFLWDRKDANGGFDQNGLYGSYVDKDELSDFTETTGENVGTGDDSETNFSGTLSAVTGVKTCMYVRITDGTETFIDDRNGSLVGNAGGTGTINYATGAFDVTFNSAPANAQAITADYYTEDATSEGIVDFSKSTPRTAGQGFVFRQDDGGAGFKNIFSIGGDEYCLHEFKTWVLTLSEDDTNATNLIYRERVGIEYWRGAEGTGDGIYYVDSINKDDASIRLLKTSVFSDEVIPKSISSKLDLVDLRFNKAVVSEWGQYILVACRTKDSTVNNRMLMYDKIWKLWNVTDFRVSTLESYNDTLIGGDDGSDNVFTLFSGVTDQDSIIPNNIDFAKDNLGREGTKICNRLVLGGLIGIDQTLEAYLSLDGGGYIYVGEIDGRGDYVDQGQSVNIGNNTIGSTEIGGGTSGVNVSPFRREFRINTDKFEFISLRLKATKVGGVAVTEYQFKDIRQKSRHITSDRIVN